MSGKRRSTSSPIPLGDFFFLFFLSKRKENPFSSALSRAKIPPSLPSLPQILESFPLPFLKWIAPRASSPPPPFLIFYPFSLSSGLNKSVSYLTLFYPYPKDIPYSLMDRDFSPFCGSCKLFPFVSLCKNFFFSLLYLLTQR